MVYGSGLIVLRYRVCGSWFRVEVYRRVLGDWRDGSLSELLLLMVLLAYCRR
jgi:hypothetical protein